MGTRHLTCHGSAISVWQLIPKRSSCQAGFGCLSPPSVSKLTSSTHSLSLTELHSSLPQLYLSQQPTDHPLHPPTPYWCMSNDSAAHCEATLRQGRYIHVTCKPNGLPVAATSGAQDAGSSRHQKGGLPNKAIPTFQRGLVAILGSQRHLRPAISLASMSSINPNQHGGLDAAWQRRRGCPTASRLLTFPG